MLNRCAVHGKECFVCDQIIQKFNGTPQEFRKQLEQYVADLIASEHYDEEEGVHSFPDSSICSICTESAKLIAKNFNGKVVGYLSRNNPIACIGEPHCEGHDFALIHSRWIVDYWAFRVAQLINRSVFDLRLSTERKMAIQWHGNPRCWVMVANFEG
jgi:hypothetical protein